MLKGALAKMVGKINNPVRAMVAFLVVAPGMGGLVYLCVIGVEVAYGGLFTLLGIVLRDLFSGGD